MKTHGLLPVFVTGIFLFSSCATPPPPSVDGTIPLDIAGAVHAGDPVSPEENALLDELGISWVRNTFYWHQLESSPGVWDFSRYDAVVEGNKNAGRKQLAVLGFDTGWIHGDGKRNDFISADELPHFINYVETLVTRYKGKVDAWEIWNEPNVPVRFWNGKAADFFALSKAAAEKIRECDSGAVIVAGSFWRAPASYIRRMFKSGALDDVDALSFHPYAVNPNGVAKQYDKFVKIIAKENFSGEVWVTEIGYPVAGWYPSRVSEARFGEYIRDTLTALATKGARTIFWYQLTDNYTKENTPKSLNSEKFFGLAYRDFEKRPGAESFAETVRALTGQKGK